MQITYDPVAKAAYVRLTGDTVASTVCLNDTVNMDIAEDGSEDGSTVVGIELLNVEQEPKITVSS